MWRRLDSASRRVAVISAVVYLPLYLWVIGDVDVHGAAGLRTMMAADPWGIVLHQKAPFQFEAVVGVTWGYVTWMLSPINLLIGTGLAGLVGLNLGTSWSVAKASAVCGVPAANGFLAALPGLLAGSACCAPAVVLLLGVQVSAGLIGLFGMMVPIAFVILATILAYNVYRLRRFRPAAL